MLNQNQVNGTLENELQQSLREAADYKYALDESCIVSITDQKGIIKYANDNFCKISKYSSEELVGRDHGIINSSHHSQGYIKSLWVTIAGGNIWRGELKNKAKDGSIYWVDSTIVPFIDKAGKPYQFVAISSDITERKKLEEQQVLHASIINFSDDAIFSKALDGTILSWNKGAEKILGYKADEIIGRPSTMLIPKHLLPEEKQMVESVRKGEVVHHYETQRIRKDGKVLTLSLTISPIKDLDGTIIGASKIARDITEQKEAQEEIIRVNREKEMALNRISDGMVSLDNEFRYTFLNDAAVATYSRSREESIGRTMWEVHPNLKNSIFWDKYHEARETKKAVEIETYYVPAEAWISVKIYPSEDGFTAFYKDITEAKKAEEKLAQSELHFRALIENSAEGITLTDEFSNVIYRSPGSLKITGQLPTKNVDNLAHPDDIGMIKSKHTEVLSKPGIPIQFQGRFMHSSGQYIWLEGTFTNLLHVKAVNAIVTNYRDISERKEVEVQLKESEEKYRSLIEQAGDSIFVVGTSMMYIDINEAGCRLTGYTKDEFLKLTPRDVVFEEDLELNPMDREKFKIGETINHERRLKRKDGTAVLIEVNAKMMQDGKVVVFARNITERKKVELALKEGEARYRNVIENIHEALIIEDQEGKLIYANPEFYSMFGFSPDEDKNLTLKDYTSPESYEKVIERHNNRMKGLNVPEEFEYKGLRKDGKEIWIEVRVSSVIENGKVIMTQSLERDITERKIAEERLVKSEKIYKTIASSIPGSVICLYDTDLRYLLIEGDMLEKLGYSKEKLMGNRMRDVIPEEIYKSVEKEFMAVLQGKPVIRETKRNGYDIITRLIPLKDENGDVYAVLTAAIDITELKTAQRNITELNTVLEEKVKERTSQLEAVNKELEGFSYSVSHDLRAPLRAVNGYASILSEDYNDKLDDEGKRLLTTIQENARKMGTLIDDLLGFSRLGRKEVKRSLIDMTEMAENAVKELKNAHFFNTRIKINHLDMVMADYALIHQVWINLLSNAIKYTQNTESAYVEISSEKKDNEIIYSVADNGAGFDMQYAHKLFGVFQRLHSDDEFEGTGVGLALVHRIITKHGGRVWAHGETGKGARFYFTLPEQETH